MDSFTYKIYNSLDSTNAEAKRLSARGHPSTWILALKQTNGRGRNGKSWKTEKNGFAASLLYYPRIPHSVKALRSYVAGIALYDCVSSLGIDKKFLTLKWPNDLLFNGHKVAGILLETVSNANGLSSSLIVGFGVNLDECPDIKALDDNAVRPGTLKSSGCPMPSPEEFLRLLMPVYHHWDKGLELKGFKVIKKAFLDRTFPLGQQIVVKRANDSTTGLFSGICDDGALRLTCPDGIKFVTSGDVAMIGD